jgi:type IV pilus assembly protein PilA
MARALHSSLPVTRQSRGFTLVELMIVVVIVSVLAMLAVVGYRKIVTSSHVSEATTMVNNIRVAQEAFHAETQAYMPAMADLTSSSAWYPQPSVYAVVTRWGAPCTTCQAGSDMAALPVHVDGPVLFGYRTIAGAASSTAPAAFSTNCTSTNVTPPLTDWFAVAAEADLDGNPSTHTDVCGFSWTTQLVINNEGQ